ncbi:hypothetical protein GGF41_003171 [Coemansia sp. RSA 2531]|nr:hypothetical protein GGI14_005369 [Coemansia sp. S680]KAJ2423356.1 hypothetical protein GGF41_003171 [Coemansia sp. RSA 2531]
MVLRHPAYLLVLCTSRRMVLLKARRPPTIQPCTSLTPTTMPRVGTMEAVHTTSTMLRHRQANSNTTHSNLTTSNSLEDIPNTCMCTRYLAQVTALPECLVACRLYSLAYVVRVCCAK